MFCVHRNEKIAAPKNNNNMLQKGKEESIKDEISTYYSKSKMPANKSIKNKNKKENISLLSKAQSQNYEIKQCLKEGNITNKKELDNKNISECHEDIKNSSKRE